MGARRRSLLAGLFVRGPEFQDEFARRIAAIPHELRMDGMSNAVAGRLIDFQVLLAPIMAARWTVLHFGPASELITITADGERQTHDVCSRGFDLAEIVAALRSLD